MTAIEEHRGGVSRRRFMALTGSSAAGVVLLAACGSDSSAATGETAQFGDGDVGILNFLLTLESLEEILYADIVKSGFFAGSALETMKKFGEEEAEHADKLTKTVESMGGEPAKKLDAKFKFVALEPALELASKIESQVAAAYLGQVPRIESTSAMETVLSIHSVEGRHAATINVALGKSFSPDGEFAKPATPKAVLKALKPFMGGGNEA